jgi:Flp pilus assembly pilin Flp
MPLLLRLRLRLRRDEDGAVTVDWVVLTAAMCVFGVAVASIVTTAANDPADGLGARLTAIEIE